jgi:hypothetical protein
MINIDAELKKASGTLLIQAAPGAFLRYHPQRPQFVQWTQSVV